MTFTTHGNGKTGGSRVITCVKMMAGSVFLLSIYDNGDRRITSYNVCYTKLLRTVFLHTGNPSEVCTLGLTPTTSTTVMTTMGDALVVMLMTKIGFTKKEYAKRHHGGYLGEKSRQEDV